MKKYILLSLLTLLFVGCGDDDYVQIDSLSSDGNEFFCNQKVKLWMCINSNDLWSVDYEWSCEGGTLTQPQGLDEMTWQAPNELGEFIVRCKVSINGKSEVREHVMNVTSYFFDKFEKKPFAFSAQSNTTMDLKTETTATGTNGYAELKVSGTSNANRYISRSFNDATLTVPFSSVAKLGWITNFPKDSITVGSNKNANSLYYQWTINRDPAKRDDIYIDDIRFEWYPVGRDSGLPTDEDGNEYQGRFRFQSNHSGTRVWHEVLTTDPNLTFSAKEYKNVSLSIDKDYRVYVYIDNNKIIETDAIRQWRIDNNCQDALYINQWRFVFPSGNGGNNVPTFYFDDAEARNDGSILK